MFTPIVISETIPRIVPETKIPFSVGLKSSMFFGYFFLLGSLLLVVITWFQLSLVIPGIFFFIVSIGAFLLIKKTKSTIQKRKKTFTNGSIVKAKVIRHEKEFNFFKSSPDYSLMLQQNNHPPFKVVFNNKSIWKNNPVGQTLTGLRFDDFYLFAESFGCTFHLKY